jgi:transcriptional regulator of acetoin/glycerol metabolism
METDEQQGFSPKKVVAGAALGVAVPAAVAVAKKFVGGNSDDSNDGDETREQDDDAARDEPMSRERKQVRRTATKAKAKASRKTAATKAAATRAKNRTREQLYAQATRLKIDGRSGMNKAELERAVDRAKQKAKAR